MVDVIDIFGELINTSNDGVQVNIQRIMNNLPSNSWESSMCVTFCLPASQDTTSAIIAANDTIDFSFHFFKMVSKSPWFDVFSNMHDLLFSI